MCIKMVMVILPESADFFMTIFLSEQVFQDEFSERLLPVLHDVVVLDLVERPEGLPVRAGVKRGTAVVAGESTFAL